MLALLVTVAEVPTHHRRPSMLTLTLAVASVVVVLSTTTATEGTARAKSYVQPPTIVSILSRD